MQSVVVAIPVKNEAERIGDCLDALAHQQHAIDHRVLLLLNDCTDGTRAIVNVIRPSLPIQVDVVEGKLPRQAMGVGYARRLAMQRAAALAGEDGILLTTDADGRVAPDWIAANLAALARDVDAVAGRAIIDPVEAVLIPPHLHADDALECRFATMLDEIDALIDPDASDPWPRHDEHSGASMAVTVRAWRRAGGVPPVSLGEDRAFWAALQRIDARLRHAPEVTVTVSGRINGRAPGGMADTIRRRIIHQDEWLDGRLESAQSHLRRALWRRHVRAAWGMDARIHGRELAKIAAALYVSCNELTYSLEYRFFGEAWANLTLKSPILRHRLVARASLPDELAAARCILHRLRQPRVNTAGPAYSPDAGALLPA